MAGEQRAKGAAGPGSETAESGSEQEVKRVSGRRKKLSDQGSDRKGGGVITTSVKPSLESAVVLGNRITSSYQQAIKIAEHVLAPVAVKVAGELTKHEWDLVAASLGEVDPYDERPGDALVSMVERSHRYYRMADPFGGDKAVASVTKKLREMCYLEVWAVVIACQFKWAFSNLLKPDDKWWELHFRRDVIYKVYG